MTAALICLAGLPSQVTPGRRQHWECPNPISAMRTKRTPAVVACLLLTHGPDLRHFTGALRATGARCCWWKRKNPTAAAAIVCTSSRHQTVAVIIIFSVDPDATSKVYFSYRFHSHLKTHHTCPRTQIFLSTQSIHTLQSQCLATSITVTQIYPNI